MNRTIICCACLLAGMLVSPLRAQNGGLSKEKVSLSIMKAQRYLKSQQKNDGSWDDGGQYKVGVTSLVVMALLNSQMPVTDPAIQRGLAFLRSIPPERWEVATERETYELSLLLMALVAADDAADNNRISRLAARIEDGQLTGGPNAGSWSYFLDGGNQGGDRSNGQFAILALREAAHYGVPVRRETWEKARRHWKDSQNLDGGWGYSGSGGFQDPSRGSMTVAGIATMVITETMLGEGGDTIDCCAVKEPDESLQRGIDWLARNFAVGTNPGLGPMNVLYYLYGLERAGRLSGRRFFGDNNDWFRAGAEYLTSQQSARGSWSGVGQLEHSGDHVLSTSFALLFLSKGLSPVVISKLKFGGAEGAKIPDDLWNRHQRDVHHLMDYISSRDGWPKLLTWQVIELNKLTDQTALPVLVQSPILFLTSDESPLLTEEDVFRIRQYLDQGGTLLASAGCDSAEFDRGFRELVKRLYPNEANLFKKLTAEHPLYRSEFLLTPDAHELWGIDFGCRTPIIYSPKDIGCYWDHWSRIDPPGRSAKTRLKVDNMMKLGTNIVAYVTGREPADKLESEARALADNPLEHIERGFLQIAKLRHEGGWDTAPMALRNLLKALNQEVGAVSTARKDYVPSDENIFNYPMLYIHGRQAFSFGEVERQKLRTYLVERDGVLFADACCGAPQFDKAFRAEMAKMFPDQTLERIPIEHELMTTPFDIREVTRRLPAVNRPGQPLETISQKSEPVLYGITIDGRLAVIYSPYDLSCALERQASLVCNGYEPKDALHIAMNIVIYSMEQGVPIEP